MGKGRILNEDEIFDKVITSRLMRVSRLRELGYVVCHVDGIWYYATPDNANKHNWTMMDELSEVELYSGSDDDFVQRYHTIKAMGYQLAYYDGLWFYKKPHDKVWRDVKTYDELED